MSLVADRADLRFYMPMSISGLELIDMRSRDRSDFASSIFGHFVLRGSGRIFWASEHFVSNCV